MAQKSSVDHFLPYSFSGTVVHGFGRGGKQLNCPTANLDDSAVAALPSNLGQGVYWGVGRVRGKKNGREGEEDDEMGFVMSIGYNPHFGNEKKTMEVHFLKTLDDFYGSVVEGTIKGFLREMMPFNGIDELVAAIRKDKEDALRLLTKEHKSKV